MKKFLLTLGLCLFLLAACGTMVAVVTNSATSALEPLQTSLDPAQNQYDDSEVSEAGGTLKPPAPEGISDGTWEVGSDIKPGKYKSAGGDICYWERQSGSSGTMNDILSNSLAAGPQVVTIKKSDYAFKTQGCAPWIRQENNR